MHEWTNDVLDAIQWAWDTHDREGAIALIQWYRPFIRKEDIEAAYALLNEDWKFKLSFYVELQYDNCDYVDEVWFSDFDAAVNFAKEAKYAKRVRVCGALGECHLCL